MRYSLKTILLRARALLLASALFSLGRPAVFAQSPTASQPLYIVTDAAPPAQPPRLPIQVNTVTGSAGLAWQGQGRVFQVESATDITGPFQPLSPILPNLSFDDPGTLTNRARSYYRLRQW
jgi:hypothetical protein